MMTRYTMSVRHPDTDPTLVPDACWSRIYHGALLVARSDGSQECWAAGQWTGYTTQADNRPHTGPAASEPRTGGDPGRRPSPLDLEYVLTRRIGTSAPEAAS